MQDIFKWKRNHHYVAHIFKNQNMKNKKWVKDEMSEWIFEVTIHYNWDTLILIFL